MLETPSEKSFQCNGTDCNNHAIMSKCVYAQSMNLQKLPSPHSMAIQSDPIKSPSHYIQGDGIECIDAIKAALTAEEFRGFCKGNVLKYVWREKYKGKDESLKKSIWYLKRIIEND